MGISPSEAYSMSYMQGMKFYLTWDYINKEQKKTRAPKEDKNVMSFDEIELKFNKEKMKK